MFERLLLPLDGSEEAEAILPYARRLTEGLGSEIVLLSVVDPGTIDIPRRLSDGPPTQHTEFSGTTDEEDDVTETFGASQYYGRIGSMARERLETLADRLSGEGLKTVPVVAFGSAAEEIVRVAETEGCHLIVMVTHGKNVFGRTMLGGVTSKVLNMSRLPTLAIRPEQAQRFGERPLAISTVVAPLDGSVLAESALPYIEDLVSKLDLEAVLVQAVRDIRPPYTAEGDRQTLGLRREIEEEAAVYLRDVAGRLEEACPRVSWKVLKGHPSWAIAEFARDTPAEIIVMATHGRSGLTRWIMGSVADSVVRYSGNPVLIVPPPETDEGE